MRIDLNFGMYGRTFSLSYVQTRRLWKGKLVALHPEQLAKWHLLFDEKRVKYHKNDKAEDRKCLGSSRRTSQSYSNCNVYHPGFTASTEPLESMFKVSWSAEVRRELFILAYVFILLTFAWYLISLSSRPDCREAVSICYRIATQVGFGTALISLAGDF